MFPTYIDFICFQIYYPDSSVFFPYMVKYANLLSDLGIALILLQQNLFSGGASCLLESTEDHVCWSADALIFLAMKNHRI